MKPSVKMINRMLGNIIEKEGSDIPSVCRRIRKEMDNAATYDQIDKALDTINEILKGYGVESIRDNNWDSYYCDIGILYVNMGDTYIPTVIYDTRKDSWYVTSWGDIVERNEKRFNV